MGVFQIFKIVHCTKGTKSRKTSHTFDHFLQLYMKGLKSQ